MKHHNLAGISIGGSSPVRIMGVINLSPESFFKDSVPLNKRSLMDIAKKMEDEGADFIDLGAQSTAPYLETHISEEEEERRLLWGIEAIRRTTSIPLSIDTSRARPAKMALEAGATILNDITGLNGDRKILPLLPKFRGLVLMAHPSGLSRKIQKDPVRTVKGCLKKTIALAVKSGASSLRMAIDPGIGFFRKTGMPWWKWDIKILSDLHEFSSLKIPILAGVSRKSFIGEILHQKNPNDRLAGSLAAATIAVMNGASIIRTHDVKVTFEAVRLAEKLRSLS